MSPVVEALRNAVARTTGLSYAQHGHRMEWELTVEGPRIWAKSVAGREVRYVLSWTELDCAVDPEGLLRDVEHTCLTRILKENTR